MNIPYQVKKSAPPPGLFHVNCTMDTVESKSDCCKCIEYSFGDSARIIDSQASEPAIPPRRNGFHLTLCEWIIPSPVKLNTRM